MIMSFWYFPPDLHWSCINVAYLFLCRSNFHYVNIPRYLQKLHVHVDAIFSGTDKK